VPGDKNSSVNTLFYFYELALKAKSEPGDTEPGTTEPGTTEPGTTEPGGTVTPAPDRKNPQTNPRVIINTPESLSTYRENVIPIKNEAIILIYNATWNTLVNDVIGSSEKYTDLQNDLERLEKGRKVLNFLAMFPEKYDSLFGKNGISSDDQREALEAYNNFMGILNDEWVQENCLNDAQKAYIKLMTAPLSASLTAKAAYDIFIQFTTDFPGFLATLPNLILSKAPDFIFDLSEGSMKVAVEFSFNEDAARASIAAFTDTLNRRVTFNGKSVATYDATSKGEKVVVNDDVLKTMSIIDLQNYLGALKKSIMEDDMTGTDYISLPKNEVYAYIANEIMLKYQEVRKNDIPEDRWFGKDVPDPNIINKTGNVGLILGNSPAITWP
jgi:hypothetical protein